MKQFTYDSLIFKHHQSQERITFSAHSSLLGKYVCKNKRICLLAGVGLRFDQLTINRKDETSLLGIPLYPDDTIAIKKIRIGANSFTFPFGFEYAFKGEPRHRQHLAIRLLIVPGSLYKVRAYTNVDSAKQVNYPMDLQQLSSKYEQQVSRFSLTVMPQLLFYLRLWNPQSSLNFTIAPLAVDLVHVNKAFIRPGMGAMFSVGFQYEFSKNTFARQQMQE